MPSLLVGAYAIPARSKSGVKVKRDKSKEDESIFNMFQGPAIIITPFSKHAVGHTP